MLLDNPRATKSNARGAPLYGFALKMSRPFPSGILEKTLKVSVENLSKAIEAN
jgi:hypothetical protein